jgi:tRNA (guanine-N7-)-methyltransferase
MTLHRREVKSFVLRLGKITQGQQNAIDNYYPQYGIDAGLELLDLNQIFARNTPKVIEIGFGMGDATWQIAKNNPNIDYLGFEVHSPGVGSLLMKIKEHEIDNLRIIQGDAKAILTNNIQNNSIKGFHVFFPDPWHKKKHNKRRLLQSDFIDMLIKKLQIDGYIHIATDWEDYAIQVLALMNSKAELINQSSDNRYIDRLESRPITKFEQRGMNLGHKVFDLYFIKR